jgi:hypothetical protein
MWADPSRPNGVLDVELSEAHRTGTASVGLVGRWASERQKGSSHIGNFAAFEERMSSSLSDLASVWRARI